MFVFRRVLATLQPAMSVGRSVRRLVGRSPLAFLAFSAFSGVFCNTAPAQTLESACFITAPAHPHATSVAVYPALLEVKLTFFSRGHATLYLAVSVGRSVGPSVRNIFELRAVFGLLLQPNRPRVDCVYPALFFYH